MKFEWKQVDHTLHLSLSFQEEWPWWWWYSKKTPTAFRDPAQTLIIHPLCCVKGSSAGWSHDIMTSAADKLISVHMRPQLPVYRITASCLWALWCSWSTASYISSYASLPRWVTPTQRSLEEEKLNALPMFMHSSLSLCAMWTPASSFVCGQKHPRRPFGPQHPPLMEVNYITQNPRGSHCQFGNHNVYWLSCWSEDQIGPRCREEEVKKTIFKH